MVDVTQVAGEAQTEVCVIREMSGTVSASHRVQQNFKKMYKFFVTISFASREA